MDKIESEFTKLWECARDDVPVRAALIIRARALLEKAMAPPAT